MASKAANQTKTISHHVYGEKLSGQGALIARKNSDGRFVICRVLHAGMDIAPDYWRTADINEARAIWKRQNAWMLEHFRNAVERRA